MKRFLALLVCFVCIAPAALAQTPAWDCMGCDAQDQTYNFCIFCGAGQTKSCPECGWTINIGGAAFCGQCGSKLIVGKLSYSHLAGAKIGDVVELGHYEQDGDTSNGKEPIRWVVMDVLEDKILLLAVNVLDVQPFDTAGKAERWLDSSLRTWMNGDFRQAAFTALEQQLLMPGKPYDNEHYAQDDQIFLPAYDFGVSGIGNLSYGQVFMTVNHGAKLRGTGIENFELAPATAYALEKDVYACDYYWEHGGSAKMNIADGDGCFYWQEPVEIYGVRPACWLSLEALEK